MSPYTSPAFRERIAPGVWLTQTSAGLDRLGYIRLDGVIQSIVIQSNEVSVVVGRSYH